MRMCINDLSSRDPRELTNEDICDLAFFFTDECTRLGIDLEAPKQCWHCESAVSGTRVYVDEPHENIESTSSMADILLVVSMSECNREITPRLVSLVDRLEVLLSAQGLRNNHYGLVGYGGSGIYA